MNESNANGVAALAASAQAAIHGKLESSCLAQSAGTFQGCGACRPAQAADRGDAKPALKRSYLLVEIKHAKPLPELTDIVAGRIYTLDGVSGVGDVTVRAISQAAGWEAIQHDRGFGHG